MLRFALRRTDSDTAQDVVAETMLVAWRRLDDVPVGAELPWCYGVARNVLANQHRTLRREAALIARLASIPLPPASDPSEVGEPDLSAAMKGLRSEDREVLRLWAWEDLAPREIAVALGISGNAATLRLWRAKKRLGTILGKSGKEFGRPGQEQVKGRRPW